MFMVRRTLFFLLSKLKIICAKIIINLLINKTFIVIFLEISNVIPSLYFYIIITAVYFFIFKILKFQSHCNYHLNSMLLGYNSIAVKV